MEYSLSTVKKYGRVQIISLFSLAVRCGSVGISDPSDMIFFLIFSCSGKMFSEFKLGLAGPRVSSYL